MKAVSPKIWRVFGALGLTIMVMGAAVLVVTGLRATQTASEELARQSLDSIDLAGSQFEVAYLHLLLSIAEAQAKKGSLSEVEKRRDILLGHIAMLGAGAIGHALDAAPEIRERVTRLERVISALRFSEATASQDLASAERVLGPGRSDAAWIRAAGHAIYNDLLSSKRAASHKAFGSFSLNLALMAVVSLLGLCGIGLSLVKRRGQRTEFETARLHAQQQTSLAQLLEDISDLLLRYGMDGRLQFAKGMEITDAQVFDFFRGSGRLACLEALEKLTPAEPGITHEVVGALDANGKARIEQWSHRLIVAEDGAADGFISTAQDITELKTLNEQLIQSSKLVALGEISAGIAHELMQPLNSLKIGLANLRRRQAISPTETPEEVASRFDRLERQVSRAGDVVHTMRLLGRQSDLKLSPVAMGDLMDEAFQLFDRPLAVLGIQLSVDKPPDGLFVLAHPQFLLQVLINLLANARDALEAGTEADARRHIHLGVAVDTGGQVQVEVCDNGPGIPPHLIHRVVEPFFTTKPPGKGMGLGLALSNRLVLLFGGTLEYGNQAGGGAFFRIVLRRATAERNARPPRTTPVREPSKPAIGPP